MNPVSFIYNEVLFRPLFNLLVGLTNILPGHSVGLSILSVTILVRLLLLPPALHQARQMQQNQEKMGTVRKQLKKVQERYKDDQPKKAEETMKIYKEAGINPASGCLPLLIQLPILIALYRVFLTGIGEETYHYLYSYVGQPTMPQFVFFGINLAATSVVLALLAGVFQFILMRASMAAPASATPADDQSAQMMASMQKNMVYVFPVMTVFISLQLPAALALYWVASTIFGIGQYYYFKHYLKVVSPAAV